MPTDPWDALLQSVAPPAAPAPAAPVAGAPPAAPVAPAGPAGPDTTDIGKLPEFIDNPDLDLWPSLTATAKQFLTSDPNELAKSLKSIRGVDIKRNASGDPYAVIKGKPYALNKPGASLQDFMPLVSSLALNLGIGAATGGAGLVASSAIAGAGSNIAMDTMNAVAQGDAPKVMDLLKSGSVGAVSGWLGGLLGSKLGGVLSRGRILDRSGNLTTTAREAIQAQGMRPDDIPMSVLTQAQGMLGGRGSPDSIRRAVAQVDQSALPVPLTRGETTGNLGQLGEEVAAREGIRGDTAPQAFKAFEAGTRKPAIETAKETIAATTAPRAQQGLSEVDVGEGVVSALRRSEGAARSDVNAAYDAWQQAASAQNLAIPTGGTGPTSLASRVQQSLSDMPTLNETLAPATKGVMDRIEQMQQTTHVTPEALEGMRRVINNAYRGARSTDRAALLRVRGAYDNWVDDVVGSATPGSPTGQQLMGMLRQARATAADRFGRFTAGERDPSGSVIEDILDGGVTPENIMHKLLGGQNRFTSGGANLYARLGRALGPGDPIMEDVRRQSVMRILGGSADQQALGSLGPEAMANNIRRALEGSGARYARNIFGERTVGLMLTMERQLQRQVRPTALSNASRSGFTGARALKGTVRALLASVAGGGTGAAVGTMIGGPAGTMVGGLAGATVGKKIAENLANKAGSKIVETATSPMGGSVRGMATKELLKSLPGASLARGLPSTTPVGGMGILDLFNDEDQQ